MILGLFSCKSCYKSNDSGAHKWDGIVMDGIATGILGTLPNFKQPQTIEEGVKRLSDLQYIMRSAKFRLFVDCVFVYTKKNE